MYDRRQPHHLPLHPVMNFVTREWERPDTVHALKGADYVGPPHLFLSSFGLHSNGKNRRPFDSGAASRGNVFLEHRKGKPKGVAEPTGVVSTYYYLKSIGDQRALLTFWWFYGYSVYQALDLFAHQGDWEHASLVLGPGGSVEGAYFAAHGRPAMVEADRLEWVDGRVVVYSARGSHASYPTAGDHEHGDRTEDGPSWETWRRLRPLSHQDWRHFAGAWGTVGTLAETTGPLGPWYKRHRM